MKYFGKTHFLKSVAAAILFTLGFVCLYHAVFTPPRPNVENNPGNIITWLFFAFWCFAFGWQFLRITDYEIDLPNKRYKITKRVWFFERKGWKYFNFPTHIDFRKGKHKCSVRIYFNRKNSCFITKFNDSHEALTFARSASEHLEVPLIEPSKK
ncbi:hypothetical protein G5B37_08310 [Rasiella rasia]|uniref:Uncharacterized protein n=1 Tax=Rasiella rasia TaxID=2744027 RepID=A0A6G6GMC7_9FLAO|nr:hypothetical protein [Rasiella rasia]QIE59563.1 hypothetical protein G5B37_08310 [Rasiella rasia]